MPRWEHPPNVAPAYRSTALRHPKAPLVIIPKTLSELTGPVYPYGRLQPTDNDLTRQHAGEPRYQRAGDELSGFARCGTANLEDAILRLASAINAAMSYVRGEIWTRPSLDHRTRRVLVLGTLIALGRWDEFRLHAGAALAEGGFSTADVREIILQQAVYCGIPAANTAFESIRDLETGREIER